MLSKLKGMFDLNIEERSVDDTRRDIYLEYLWGGGVWVCGGKTQTRRGTMKIRVLTLFCLYAARFCC